MAVGESKAGNPLVTFVLVGTSNENKGLRDWKRNMLMSKDNRAHLRGEMETIGLTWPDDPRELGESLDEAKGLEVKFDVIDRDEFHNIYFTDVMGEPESAEEAEEEAEEAEEAEEEENETPQYTKKEIKVMKPKALNALAEDLDLDPDDYDDTDDLRKAVMEALEL